MIQFLVFFRVTPLKKVHAILYNLIQHYLESIKESTLVKVGLERELKYV